MPHPPNKRSRSSHKSVGHNLLNHRGSSKSSNLNHRGSNNRSCGRSNRRTNRKSVAGNPLSSNSSRESNSLSRSGVPSNHRTNRKSVADNLLSSNSSNESSSLSHSGRNSPKINVPSRRLPKANHNERNSRPSHGNSSAAGCSRERGRETAPGNRAGRNALTASTAIGRSAEGMAGITFLRSVTASISGANIGSGCTAAP